jgi:hypothetical protein
MNQESDLPMMEETNSLATKEVFATFCYAHVDYGKEEYNKLVDYWKISISKTYPDCNIGTVSFYTPEETFIPARTMMYKRLRNEVRGNLIFLDTDIIAYNRLPSNFWEEDFDIGLTNNDKTWPLMPFNGGVVFSKDTDAAKEYFELMELASCNVAEGLPGWWTDQLAQRLCYDQLKEKVKFKIFHHKLYNFIPETAQATEAYFVHCKGPRKHLMRQYLASLLGTDHF